MSNHGVDRPIRPGFQRNLWVLLKRSEQLPGQWVGYCPDLDLISQGDSLRHAFDMISEAMTMTVVDDLTTNFNTDLRRAPDECWQDLWSVVDSTDATRTGVAGLMAVDEDQIDALAAQVVVCAWTVQDTAAERPVQKMQIPALWPHPTPHRASHPS